MVWPLMAFFLVFVLWLLWIIAKSLKGVNQSLKEIVVNQAKS